MYYCIPPNVNFSIMHPCNHFGLWTVNKKLDECVTLYIDFLEMSYELNIKMKCLAPLHLGDVKNCLVPPRTGDIMLSHSLIIYTIYVLIWCNFNALSIIIILFMLILHRAPVVTRRSSQQLLLVIYHCFTSTRSSTTQRLDQHSVFS